MGYGICGKRDILVLIRISVFRDYILEPRYYNPYLRNIITLLTYITSIPRYYVTVLRVTSELILIS